ncbi:MAG: hypothetical protein ACXAD7_16655 [Candidatus Kariarchaeaceae archaeon]
MSDEEWVRTLSIPGIALPGLRDLRILFVALLEFDLLLGPVAYSNEISRGSSFIKKLLSQHTLSEAYAGVARSPQHQFKTREEDIVVFRYEPEGEIDRVNVLLISCMPNSDLEPVTELGQKAMFRAKGKPELIGRELSSCLREKLTFDKKYKTLDLKTELIIWDDDRLQKPLDLDYVKGLLIYDLESKIADVRNLPMWIDGKEIIPKVLLSFIDNQIQSIGSGSATSLLFKNLPFLATKISKKETYVIIYIHDKGLIAMKKISHWLIPLADTLVNEWKLASQDEILSGLTMFDQAKKRNTTPEYQVKYARMLFRSERIRPIEGRGNETSIDPPLYINKEIWGKIGNLDGKLSLAEMSKQWKIDLIDIVTLFEWARIRNLVEFLQE